MPGPSSAICTTTYLTLAFRADTWMREPSGVYLMALFTMLITTWTISRASISAMMQIVFQLHGDLMLLRALPVQMWRSASANHLVQQFRLQMSDCMVPFSMRVTESRFSTRLISHMESS